MTPVQEQPPAQERRRFGWRRTRRLSDEMPPPATAPTRKMPAVEVEDEPTRVAPPGYTLYRPSGTDPTARLEDEDR
ncbi:hypothetical protein [Dactylosporangium sp. AC04546]|uniref:hypothetical protein n=1 Tax=Dactylosporangium sp. AC04546 TaxID=2862460 RepID=UPI003FA466C3